MLLRSAAVAVLILAHGAAAELQTIAGYKTRTDVQDYLEKDLIQKELEDAIGDETCESFAFARGWYTSGSGVYWQGIPTYTDNISTEYFEMTKFYKKDNFLQRWIDGAVRRKKTTFGQGNHNFGLVFNNLASTEICVGFEEVLKKGTAYTGTLIEMYQLMQKAIDAADGTLNGTPCINQKDGCEDAIHAWDAAVAIYVGSIEGVDGSNTEGGTYGKTPYTLADKRCRNFGTCGPERNGQTKDMTAPINIEILSYMSAGSQAAYFGDHITMKKYLSLVSAKSVVPLLQGLFRYYSRMSDTAGVGTWSKEEKEMGEGAAFAFGAMPKLWACSTKGFKKAEKDIKLGGTVVGKKAGNFKNIKYAFECNYKCLGITCADVGELFDGEPEPKLGTEMCDDELNGSLNKCGKQKVARRKQCRIYAGRPGIKGRA